MKKNNGREIPLKNYIILGLVVLLTLGLVYYFYLWYITYEESKLNETIMDRYLEVINYNELNDYIVENRNAMIYTSVLEDNNIRKFEIKFKNIVVKNALKDKILYMDMTDIFKDKIKYTELRNSYQVNNYNITNVPCILVFKDAKLVDIYSIKDNDYNTEDVLNYIIDNEMSIEW